MKISDIVSSVLAGIFAFFFLLYVIIPLFPDRVNTVVISKTETPTPLLYVGERYEGNGDTQELQIISVGLYIYKMCDVGEKYPECWK